MFHALEAALKLRFKCPHQKGNSKQFIIARWVHMPELGPKISNAHNVSFDINGRKISVCDYFAERYNIRLRYPQFPLVETPRTRDPATQPPRHLYIPLPGYLLDSRFGVRRAKPTLHHTISDVMVEINTFPRRVIED